MKKVLCETLADAFKDKIKDGTWKIGSRIPGELELAKMFGVGRSSVREALNILQEQKMLKKRNGVGTFVIADAPVITNPLLRLDSVGKMIEAVGYQARSVAYEVSHEQVGEEMADTLTLAENEQVVVIHRGRIADEKPVAFSYNIMPEKLIKDAFDSKKAESIFGTLKKCGIQVAYAKTELCGLNQQNPWDKKAAEFLKSPIVLLKQLHYDEADRPVLYSFDYINTDIVKLNLRREME